MASQATAVAGLPSTAPAAPVSMTSPLRRNTAPMVRRSTSLIGVARPPSTMPADEALSAMVSQSLIFQSLMRESMISMAGTTYSVARSTSATLQPGHDSASPRMTLTTGAHQYKCWHPPRAAVSTFLPMPTGR